MTHEIVDISVRESTKKATLTTYFIDKSDSYMINVRPLVLICPGGGYSHVSVREGEFIALQFAAAGIHAAVVDYSVSPATYPTALREVARAINYIRDNADKYGIDKERILIQGSSAGAHLAASFAIFNKDEIFKNYSLIDPDKLEVNGVVLSYPVITSGEFAHRGSFDCLLKGCEDSQKLMEKMSLEKQDLSNLPPVFIWHTFEDVTVPLENSLLFMQALRKYKVVFESHIYPVGRHGLALGNECTSSENSKEVEPYVEGWMDLCINFIKKMIK